MPKSIFITGASGFVGKNVISYFKNDYYFKAYKRDEAYSINQDIVFHFAGKAHDLKRSINVNEYYTVNTEFTKDVFERFLGSKAKVFIMLSSVKALADSVIGEMNEEFTPNPITHYGKSKLLAEQYILERGIPQDKRIYILRPCMIHGPGNKGNLNLLYKIVRRGFPWPLGAFENKRSFCSIENLCFVIKELIEREDIPSGCYNISDDEPLSTNELVSLICSIEKRRFRIYKFPVGFVNFLARVGDFFYLPINSDKLQKLTENYVVDNSKIKSVIRKKFPLSARDGIIKTLESFISND